MTPVPTTLVSVVFEAERELQLLQARSLDRWAADGLFEQLIVLDNSVQPASVRWQDKLRAEYGRWADKVEIVTTQQLTSSDDAPGWVRQQVAKLAVSSMVATDSYLVLDAKNHLVNPLGADDLTDARGRLRLRRIDYRGHPLQNKVERVIEFLGLDPSVIDEPLPGTTTPHIFATEQVGRMWSWLDQLGEGSAAETFVSEGLIEFVLHGLWLRREGILGEVHGEVEIPSVTLWPRHRELTAVRDVLQDAHHASVLGVHRTAVARMSKESRGELARFWSRANLFDDERAARRFLAGARRQVAVHALRKRLTRTGR